jgi:hypothetical protein
MLGMVGFAIGNGGRGRAPVQHQSPTGSAWRSGVVSTGQFQVS